MAELDQIQHAWDEIAPGYDEFVTPTNTHLAEAALERAGLNEDMRVLDVASGSGALSLAAARKGATVLATDIAPTMIDRLLARARDEGLATVEGRVMDGHALDLEDDTFDLAGSQFGVMLFPDLPRGLAEMARVTRPGGRVLVVTMGPPPEVEFLTFFVGAIKSVVPDFEGFPLDPPPLPFQVADPEVLQGKLEAAGLTEVTVETANHRMEFQRGVDLWDWVTSSNPIGAGLVADLSAEQAAEVVEVLDERLRERAGGSGPAVLNNTVNIGIGTKGTTE